MTTASPGISVGGRERRISSSCTRLSICIVSYFGNRLKSRLVSRFCPGLCSLLGPGNSLNGMAHTVQRSSASGKRKAAPPSSSDPPTPSPKKKGKAATARKSTGGRAPVKHKSRIEPEGGEHVSFLCYFTWMLTGVT